MKPKIGVYGSNHVESDTSVQAARALGEELARHGMVVITGACSGMPYAVAQAARQQGAEVWGFTPALSRDEHQQAFPHDDHTIYDRLFYVPAHYRQLFFLSQTVSSAQDWGMRLKYRNVISTIHADAGIIIAGGWGSLNEFTNLIYEGKPIGVLTGTGGLADEMPHWFPRLRKKSESQVLFSSQPAELVTLLTHVLEKRGIAR
jgi:predicted Rossmann-fold nucleotide-binding protein